MASLVGAKRSITAAELPALLKSNEAFGMANISARNGDFVLRRTGVLDFVEKANAPAPVVTDVPETLQGLHLRIPKIPFAIFNHIFAFTREVYKKDRTEATMMVFYNKEENLFYSWVPLQSNSGANSKYKRDEDPEFVEMEKKNLLVMVAHSHPWGGTVNGKPGGAPGPSGTDANDEKDAILYMILGSVESKYPSYCLSTCPDGNRKFLTIDQVFDMNIPAATGLDEKYRAALNRLPTDAKVELMADPTALKIDESYMKRCTKEVAAYRGTTTYGDGYSGYGYGRDYSKGTGWNSQYSFLDTLTHAEESAIVLAETILGESPDLSGVRDDVLLYALSLEYKEINEYIKELEVDGRSAVSRFRTCYEGSLPKTRPADEPKVETDQNVPTGGPDEGHPSGCAIQPAVEREDGTADSGTADPLGTETPGTELGSGIRGVAQDTPLPERGPGSDTSHAAGSVSLPAATATKGSEDKGKEPAGQKPSLKLVTPKASLIRTTPETPPPIQNPALLPVTPAKGRVTELTPLYAGPNAPRYFH